MLLNQFTQITDKVPIFAGFSVKPGPKRLNFYGQTAVFDHFVRNQNAFYGQTGIFQRFVRKFLAIMLMIYGQTAVFGAFVRKTGSEASEFLRTNGCF